MNNTITSVETAVELENHIFIHTPDKKGGAAAHCYHCGKSPEEHRWKSPHPWPPTEKDAVKHQRSSDD